MTAIDPLQAKINRQLGLSDETFLKYNPEPQHGQTPRAGTLAVLSSSKIDPLQQAINRQLGLSDEVFLKYNP